jgi:hypothetical protein
MISVTPIDKTGTPLPNSILVSVMAIRKIEPVAVEKPLPSMPEIEGHQEPVAAQPGAAKAVGEQMVVSMITFLDGNQMHVKEPMGNFNVLIA